MPSDNNTNYTFLHRLILFSATLLLANAADIYLDWNVALNNNITPLPSSNHSVITINGKFPGPLINATTNDVVHVNVHNYMDEPLLFTWNGIQQRLNSWQDGVSGTNCPIQPNTNWTYEFHIKDQIGTFFYFPSLNFQKAAGGYGPIRVNNRDFVPIPFAKPEAEFDLLVGDWFLEDYKELRSVISRADGLFTILMNGKMPYGDPASSDYASFTVVKGKTYMLRISNVGSAWSCNLRIQNHKMVLVETEGSYTKQMTLESLDVHVGQSYSVLVTADQQDADFYIMASPKMFHSPGIFGLGVLHYSNSKSNVTGPLPNGPDPFDISSSINQARSIKWNLTTGAARRNPQGSFNVAHVRPTQTFILISSTAEINNVLRYVVNNVSYNSMEDTPLKLADYFGNMTSVLKLDSFPVQSISSKATIDTFVVSGRHKGWIELVFKNDLDNVIDSWHLDGFSFFVVGFGTGDWTYKSRSSYNLVDPVVRSTTQIYPKGWTVVYAYLDNPGIWNLRSQRLHNWYLGQELYIRVHDDDPNPAKEKPPPKNLLLCGKFVNHKHEPVVHEHEIREVAPAPVAAPWIGNVKWPLPSDTPIPSPAAHVRKYWIGTRPAPPWRALPPNAPPPAPAQTSSNSEIGTKEGGERDLLRTGIGLESRTTIFAATMSPPTVAPTPTDVPTSRTTTPSPISTASEAIKTIEKVVHYHLQPTQRRIPASSSSAPAPSPTPFVSEERASTENVADYHSKPMNASPTQAPAPVPISRSTALPSWPTPSFSGARTLAHAFPPSSETRSPTPSASRARETIETISDHHFHSTNGPQAPAPSSDPRAPAPSSGPHTPPLTASISGAQRSTEKLAQYHSKPINNIGETQSLAPAPYAPTPTPIATPVPAPTPIVAPTHGSTWARWWWT